MDKNITVLIDGVEHKLQQKLTKDIKVFTPKYHDRSNITHLPTYKKIKKENTK